MFELIQIHFRDGKCAEVMAVSEKMSIKVDDAGYVVGITIQASAGSSPRRPAKSCEVILHEMR
jgi:hypothetical protein